MTEKPTFREAAHEAADAAIKAYRHELGDVRLNLARAFLKSLEAQGWKVIGPEVTPRMQVAGGDDMNNESVRMAADQWAHFSYLFRQAVANAPTVTDLMGDER